MNSVLEVITGLEKVRKAVESRDLKLLGTVLWGSSPYVSRRPYGGTKYCSCPGYRVTGVL